MLQVPIGCRQQVFAVLNDIFRDQKPGLEKKKHALPSAPCVSLTSDG
jgi:hypothetical protein